MHRGLFLWWYNALDMQETLIHQPGDMLPLARDILGVLPQATDHATLLALHGELGAGKTTFVQALARALGITEQVVSPTFVVMRQYAIPAHERFAALIHIDAYRIESLDELAPLRFNELVRDPRNLVCIEWAGKIESALLTDAVHLHFTHAADDLRKIVYGFGPETE